MKTIYGCESKKAQKHERTKAQKHERKTGFLLLLWIICLPIFAQLTIQGDSVQSSAFDSPIELSEVIVSARMKNMQSRGLGNMQINSQQLKVSPLFFGERDIIKTLQFLPGVSAGMQGSSQLNIRGGTNDQTLYLLDDVPVYNQNHTFGFFSIFNSDAIKSVDLYKGGIPTQYGDKLSGVVAVSLKDGDFKKHNTSISMGLLAGTLASDGYIVKDKLSYNFAGRRSFLDLIYNGVMALAGEEGGGIFMISFYDVNGKLSWKINDRNSLSWQVYSGYDDIYAANRETTSSGKYAEKMGFGWKNFMTSMRYYSQLKPNLLFSNTAYYTTLDNFNRHKSSLENEEEKATKDGGTSSLLTEIGNKLSFEHRISEKNTLFYGLEGAYQKYTPDYVYRESNNHRIAYYMDNLELFKFSGYANSEFSHKQWFLNAGIRASCYDNMKNRQFVIEPRIKANYFLDEKNKFMIAYDRMYQPVHTVNEMNYNVQTDYWVPYREDKLPQSSQISVGWKNYTTPDLSISVEAYYKKMSNLLLIRNLENYMDFHTDFETGKGSSMGVELLAEYSKNRLTAWLSYTLSKSDRTFGGETYPFKYDAPHSLSAFGNYIVRKREKRESSLSVNVQYKIGYPYYVPNIEYPSPGLPAHSIGYVRPDDMNNVAYIPNHPNTRLPDYFRIDLNYTIDRKLKRGNLVWQFSLLNATNRHNPYAIYMKDGKYKAITMVPILPSISFKRSF
ncbi:MAG: TonB-dependent receptor plug domain-containing protein [Tannerella sp.]|nr:TonB-dependent receptor plug domain-containing protein [Tannerella sp.]